MAEQRSRRHDPERRERIITVTLGLIEEQGVAAVSHRTVAKLADVPLGSMTYHFTNLDELLYLAFEKLIAQAVPRFEAAMAFDGDPREAVTRLILDESLGVRGDLVIAIELYRLAARDPQYRTLTQRWMRASRAALSRRFPAEVVPALDALIEGLVLHASLSTEPYNVTSIRAAVDRITAPAPLSPTSRRSRPTTSSSGAAPERKH